MAEARTLFYRSTDRGQTWEQRGDAYGNASQSVTVVPEGVPFAGRILVASRNKNAAYSADRGDTWVLPRPPEAPDDSVDIERIAVVTAGPRAGRLVGVGLWGIVTSDDGGHTWQKNPDEWAYFQQSTACVGTLRGQAPDGSDRVLSVINDPRVPTKQIYVTLSDDGGETWRRTAGLDPGSFPTCVEVVDLGGGHAVAVMFNGPLWGTEDGGETWSVWAPSPVPETGRKTTWAQVGPDGRLYVGVVQNGGESVYDQRTTVSVVSVAGESPPEASGAGLSVSPNPSSGAVRIEVRAPTPEAVAVAVFDARGRAVARAVASGGAVEVDTSSWPVGVYVARATVGGETVSARFTVIR